MSDINKLNEYAKELNIELSDLQLDQFQKYYELLIEWNEKINLTAITEFDDVLIKHFIDSISIVKADNEEIVERIISGDEVSLIDIGCGAGFPSLPLKIAFPNLKVTMLDSLNKRIKFLDEVITNLGLTNIRALHGRAEDFAKAGKDREKYDIAVSRAVANLSTLSEYCMPYVKLGGSFIAYKADLNKEELEPGLKAIKLLGGSKPNIYEFNLVTTDMHRSLCVIRKEKSTPSKFPRKAGLPAKEPIGVAMKC